MLDIMNGVYTELDPRKAMPVRGAWMLLVDSYDSVLVSSHASNTLLDLKPVNAVLSRNARFAVNFKSAVAACAPNNLVELSNYNKACWFCTDLRVDRLVFSRGAGSLCYADGPGIRVERVSVATTATPDAYSGAPNVRKRFLYVSVRVPAAILAGLSGKVMPDGVTEGCLSYQFELTGNVKNIL